MADVTFEQDGFQELSHPIRLGILEALGDRLRESPDAPTLGFSDLRRAVGVRDSGNFNYHLDKLRGRFVRNTESGYQITAAGLRVVAAAISGTYGGTRELGPTSLDEACPACGQELTARYSTGLVTVSCPNDHEFRHPLPQGAVAERGLDDVVQLLTLTVFQDLRLAADGVCPLCNAGLSWCVEPPFDAVFPHFSTQCERCGSLLDLPPVVPVLTEPAGVCFYHDHGVDIRREPPWSPAFYRDVNLTDDSPVEVAISRDGAVLRATIDRDLTVVETNRTD